MALPPVPPLPTPPAPSLDDPAAAPPAAANPERAGAEAGRARSARRLGRHPFLRRAAGAALAVLVCVAGVWWATSQNGKLPALLMRLPDPARITAWLRQPDLSALPGLPRQWNPWTPLTLEEPDGPLTRWKLDRLEAAPTACLQWLADAPSIASTPLPDRTTGAPGGAGSCGWKTASRISSVGEARFSSPFTLTCGATVALARWERHVLQPAARAQLGAPVVRIEHFGSYACRRIAGSAGPGRLSEHAHANALDVAAFTLADGRRISVLGDWPMGAAPSARATEAAASRPEGDASATPGFSAPGEQKTFPLATPAPPAPAPNPKAAFLRQARDGACKGFMAVLGPDYNAAHRNHFHLDRGPYRVCR